MVNSYITNQATSPSLTRLFGKIRTVRRLPSNLLSSMSVSLNVARAWAEAAFTAGHREGVENPDLPETITIDEYRPKRGKKASTAKKVVDKGLASAEYNTDCCDARVWNQGYGGQCSKSPFDSGHFCALHQKQYNASLEKGGTDLRNGRYSLPTPERTLDGSDEKIPWKSGDGPSLSPKKDDVKNPRPRGPAPKSDSGGRKVWDGEVGVWSDPKVDSGSDTEDMSDEEIVQPVVETAAKETVAEETVAEETVAEETVAEETVAVETAAEETLSVETVAEETVAVETVAEETVAEETVADETVAVETVAVETVAVETVAEETVAVETVAVETVAVETVAEETVAEDQVVFVGENFEPEPEAEPEAEPEPRLKEDLELDEDGDLAAEPPSSSGRDPCHNPTIKGENLWLQGVEYVFDAEDGMMYHIDTYDEVATFDGSKVVWNTKKFEISHKKAACDVK